MSTSHILQYIFSKLERVQLAPLHVVFIIVFVGIVRSFLEFFHGVLGNEAAYIAFYTMQSVAFYAGMFFLFMLAITTFLPQKRSSTMTFVGLGVGMGLVPPIIDMCIGLGDRRYEYFESVSLIFISPHQAIGESIVLWLIVFLTGLFFWYQRGGLHHGMLGAIVAYAVLQFSMWFFGFASGPLLLQMYNELPVRISADPLLIRQTFLAVLWYVIALTAFVVLRFNFFTSVLKQGMYIVMWGLLTLLGASLGGILDTYIFVKALLLVAIFFLMQTEHAFYDRDTNTVMQPHRSITAGDLVFVRFFQLLPVFVFIFFDPTFSLLLALLCMIGFVHSSYAFNLKRYWIAVSFLAGIAALLCMLVGYLYTVPVLSHQGLATTAIIAFLFALFSNMRGYKDLEGGRVMGVRTLYTLLTEKGAHASMIHATILFILGSLATITFMIAIPHVPVPILILSGVALFGTILTALQTYTRPQISTTWAIVHVNVLLLFLTFIVVPLFRNVLI